MSSPVMKPLLICVFSLPQLFAQLDSLDCTYNEILVNSFLPGFASGCTEASYPLLVAAEECCACDTCTGVTCEDDTEQSCSLRGSYGTRKSASEISYKKTVTVIDDCVATYDAPETDRYIPGYACENTRYYGTLLEAQQECCICEECTGVTANAQGTQFQLRSGESSSYSRNGETSYIKLYTTAGPTLTPADLYPGRQLCYDQCQLPLRLLQLIGRLEAAGPTTDLNVAQNKLVFSILEPVIAEKRGITVTDLSYADWIGTQEMREAWANVLQTHILKMDPPYDPVEMADKIAIVSGARVAVEMVVFSILTDNDGIIITAPYRSAFVLDICQSIGGYTVPAYMRSEENFDLNIDILQEAYDSAAASGITVKALLITNPNNPTGHAYSMETLMAVADWATNLDLHIISDELYALSKCDVNGPEFVSMTRVLDPRDYDKLHVVYGVSKDWGMAGTRVGVLYSEFPLVKACTESVDRFRSVSTDTQFLLTRMLEDDAFVTSYIPQMQVQLQARFELVKAALDGYGIQILSGGDNAGTYGLYVLLDLRPYIEAFVTSEEEGAGATHLHELMLGWALEDNAGVTLGRGEWFGFAEPGWYRLVFADTVSDTEILDAIDRMAAFLSNFS